jgi:hypothetical protein
VLRAYLFLGFGNFLGMFFLRFPEKKGVGKIKYLYNYFFLFLKKNIEIIFFYNLEKSPPPPFFHKMMKVVKIIISEKHLLLFPEKMSVGKNNMLSQFNVICVFKK